MPPAQAHPGCSTTCEAPPVRAVRSARRLELLFTPETHVTPKTTWQPFEGEADADHDHRLDAAERRELPESAYAVPAQRKLPVTDAAHVRAALGRFDQVEGITDAERDLAFANLRKAAAHYGVEIVEERWQDLGRAPHTRNPARE